MEGRSKRAARAVGPVEIRGPAVAPGEVPRDAIVETAMDSIAIGPSPASDSGTLHASPALPTANAGQADLGEIGQDALAALAEYRAVLARGLDAISEEMAGLARSGIDAATRTAIEMLAVKTVSDAIAVNAGFARAGFDNWISGSAKFSELGARLAIESSRPFLAQLSTNWSLVPPIDR